MGTVRKYILRDAIVGGDQKFMKVTLESICIQLKKRLCFYIKERLDFH